MNILTQSLIKLNNINEELNNIDKIAEKRAAEIFTDDFKKSIADNFSKSLEKIFN